MKRIESIEIVSDRFRSPRAIEWALEKDIERWFYLPTPEQSVPQGLQGAHALGLGKNQVISDRSASVFLCGYLVEVAVLFYA